MQNIVISKGGILGGLLILITLSLYMINPSLMTEWWLSLVIILLYVVVMVLAVKSFKDSNSGFATFGQAMMTSWLTGIIGGTIAMLFTYTLYNFIDPSLIELAQQKSIEMMEAFAGNMSEDEYEKLITKMESQNQFGFQGQILGWLSGSFVGLLISLIIAAITKNENNDFA